MTVDPDETPFVVRFTPAMRCDHDALNIEDCTQTWGLGWCCNTCGRPVAIRITHYGSEVPQPNTPTMNLLHPEKRSFAEGVGWLLRRRRVSRAGDVQ